ADLWRHLMAVDLSFFQSQTAQKLRQEGREEGRAEGQANALLLLLHHRGVEVTDGDRERIESCDDLDVLDLWLTRAIAATSMTEVLAAAGEVSGSADWQGVLHGRTAPGVRPGPYGFPRRKGQPVLTRAATGPGRSGAPSRSGPGGPGGSGR